MIKNIFFAVLALAMLFVGYQIFDIYNARTKLNKVDDTYKSGPASANLEVVEFLDYGCPYCREAHPTITQAVERDGNITYIPRPVAFLGPNSAYAAVIAYGAAEQGKFFEMHDALIRNFESLSEETLPDIAAQAGVDYAALQKALEAGHLQEKVIENLDIFESLGHRATPTFIIGGGVAYTPEGRMPEVDDFLKMFDQARGQAQ